MKTSIWTELLDIISPRWCAVCGNRLSPDEALLCRKCMSEMPVTPFCQSPYDNLMARLFWGQFPIERASAWFFFRPQSAPTKMVYDLKYHGQIEWGELMGEQMALAHQPYGFFNDIDAIIPMPIAHRRIRERGYNQCEKIARGIKWVTKLPVYSNVIVRHQFEQSQTHQSAWERRENVSNAFQLIRAEKIKGKHLLLVDDVVTTGATVIACAQELAKADDVKISVLAVGYTKE